MFDWRFSLLLMKIWVFWYFNLEDGGSVLVWNVSSCVTTQCCITFANVCYSWVLIVIFYCSVYQYDFCVTFSLSQSCYFFFFLHLSYILTELLFHRIVRLMFITVTFQEKHVFMCEMLTFLFPFQTTKPVVILEHYKMWGHSVFQTRCLQEQCSTFSPSRDSLSALWCVLTSILQW